MKKLFAVLMTLLFLGSTTGLVLAQAAAATPVAKKVHKHRHHVKLLPHATTAPAGTK